MVLQVPKAPFARRGNDGLRSHMPHPLVLCKRFTFTGTAAVHKLGTVPAYAVFNGATAHVLTAFNGTAPTVIIGTYDTAGEVDDADELIDNNDFDLTTTGFTSDTSKLGILNTNPRDIVVTFAATAAPSAGEVILGVTFILPELEVVALS